MTRQVGPDAAEGEVEHAVEGAGEVGEGDDPGGLGRSDLDDGAPEGTEADEIDELAPEVPPVDSWAASVLGIELGPPGTGAWLDERIATRAVPGYERASATVALALAPELIEVAAFSRGERTGVREVEVATRPGERRWCPEIGSMVAWRHGEVPVISWIELDDGPNGVRIVAVAPTRSESEAAASALVELVRGEASTWRGQAVVLDPAAEALVVHRPAMPAADLPVASEVVDELARNLVVPLQRWDELGSIVPRRGVLLYGPPGSGKHRAVEHVIGCLPGTTVVVAAPRCLLSGDLVRLVYDLAADAAPALVVLEDIDVAIGDWSASPAPEGLIELVAQIDGSLRRTGVFTLATTNDGAAGEIVVWQRTGRFDRLIELGPPSDGVRRQVLADMATRHGQGEQVVRRLLGRTVGWTFGQLAELERLAVLAAAADGGPVDLVGAVDQVRSQVRAHVVPPSAIQGQGGSYL